MRKKIVAANWKMNMNLEEGIKLVLSILQKIPTESDENRMGILCPPFIHLSHIQEMLKDKDHLLLGAQNCHWKESGAFTGEISVNMLKSVGTRYVIIGHSERRNYFQETNEQLIAKVGLVLENDLIPIFCCGEQLSDRNEGTQNKIVRRQLKEGLFHLAQEQISRAVIAYEPVWAIGTGETASPEQAGEMHDLIRSLLRDQYGDPVADGIPVLYGGSVKPENAEELFSMPNVDGGLVGGASLDAEKFVAIYNSI